MVTVHTIAAIPRQIRILPLQGAARTTTALTPTAITAAHTIPAEVPVDTAEVASVAVTAAAVAVAEVVAATDNNTYIAATNFY